MSETQQDSTMIAATLEELEKRAKRRLAEEEHFARRELKLLTESDGYSEAIYSPEERNERAAKLSARLDELENPENRRVHLNRLVQAERLRDLEHRAQPIIAARRIRELEELLAKGAP